MLPAEPVPGPPELPAANLATEYTSGSFKDFFAEDDDETGDDAAPTEAAAGSAASRKRRSLVLTLALGVAVLIVAAVTAGLMLVHQHTGQQAQTSRPPGVVPTASASAAATPSASATHTPSASAAPTTSPTPPLAVVPAQQTAPTPVAHWSARSGDLDRYRRLLAAEQALLRARQRLQFGQHLPFGGPRRAFRPGAPPYFGGLLGSFHHR